MPTTCRAFGSIFFFPGVGSVALVGPLTIFIGEMVTATPFPVEAVMLKAPGLKYRPKFLTGPSTVPLT